MLPRYWDLRDGAKSLVGVCEWLLDSDMYDATAPG